MRLPSWTLATCALLGVLAPVANPQDEQGEKPKPSLEDMLPGAGSEPSAQEEMIELFQEVERRLSQIGSFLTDASAGDTSRLKDAEESGIADLLQEARPDSSPTGSIGDLLEASRTQGEHVLEDIDRILELAAQNGGT